MMDGEKRIVTFMGEFGRRTAHIIWCEQLNMFKVDCILGKDKPNAFKLFNEEGDAQRFAEEFVWEKKYGNV